MAPLAADLDPLKKLPCLGPTQSLGIARIILKIVVGHHP